MNISIISRIKNYLDIYATADVKKRGEILFGGGSVMTALISKSNETAEFKVQGTYLYNVNVNGLNSYIDSTCSCPFDWGPVCKHQVAALLYLIEHFGGKKSNEPEVVKLKPTVKIKKTKPETRLSSAPFLLGDFKIITADLVRKHISNFSFYNFYGKIDTVLFTQNKLHFKISESSYYHPNENIVQFNHTPEGIQTVCNCNQRVTALCHHQSYLLLKIANSANPDIFQHILPENLKHLQNAILNKYGLENQPFEKFFDLTYANFKIDYIHRDDFKFLVPVIENEKFDSGLKENFRKLDNDLIRMEKPVIQSGKTEKRHPGFVFRIYSSNSSHFKDALECIIISGKENKSGDTMVSGIRDYREMFNSEYFVLNKNQKELFEKIVFFEASEKRYRNNGDLIDRQLNCFEFLKRIFPLLLEEKYIYVESSERVVKSLKKSGLKTVFISSHSPDLEFDVAETDLFIELIPSLVIQGIKYNHDNIDSANSHFLFSCIDDKIYLHKSIAQSLLISQFGYGRISMVKSEANKFFEKYIKPVAKYSKVNFSTQIFSLKEDTLKHGKRQVFLSEIDDYVVFKPIFLYNGEIQVSPGSTGSIIVKDSNNNIVSYFRDEDAENEFLDFMAQLHREFESQRHTGIFSLDARLLLENFWFFDAFAKMEAVGTEVYGFKDLKSFKYSPYRAKVTTGIKSGQDWFEVDVKIAFGDNTIDLKSIRKAILNHEKYVRLSDGSIGIMPEEWIQKLERYFRTGEISDNRLKISKLKFTIVEELFNNIKDEDILKELAEKKRKLREINNVKTVRKPKEITAKLRDYQKEGMNWLNLLNEMGWGGILADDMGLGKTLQILTLIQIQVKKTKKANLIVVPTTLLFNWEMELKKFAPQLTFHFYYGINRDKEIKSFKKYHIIFTTYGVMTRDIEFLRNYKFNYIILDESQAIKNPLSLRYKAAFLLQAENKLTLTGTPIENSTFDLFAQMNFVNPGFLGSVDNFRLNYSNAIDKEGNAEVAAELNRMINPFILRRTKEQVAKELPPKTETILFCEMGGEQRTVYDAYRNKYRNRLLGLIESEGLEKSKIYVLEGLMKLRQVCDSTAILSDEENYGSHSIKIDELKRHINEKTSNHKILVFSQFVRMLKLIREELIRAKIDYEYLDGKSSKKQREESVNRFQEVAGCRVFLISLKAGGMGLNLTAADYVYLVDPWWNPAVENQAIDRTHRIGQGKNVFAYRMICKNTVEEKILNLQAKKIKIARDIIATDESFLKKLTEKDIKELFG